MEALIFIVVIHWIADFIFQDEEWALNKSNNLNSLLKHTVAYSSIWFIAVAIYTYTIYGSLLFTAVTFILHTVTDYITSPVVSKKFANGEHGSSIPNLGAFTIIGFDQVLHYIQLIVSWYLIFGL